MKKTKKICCICKNEYIGFGNNAEPLKKGRCCDKCNGEVIISRIKRRKKNPEILRLQDRLDDLDQAISDAKEINVDYYDLEDKWNETNSRLTDINV